ncbi:hypothetical protein Glove_82g48 [Diversispora epigaea]|uniref:Uncharacterized protein n=1 Tax=Diversispora epigaea TaxID=1348612 RepID=A0A397J7S2_9GLOM|nr:hypothetical protein Glove_82g48 [Diversispora epigaea]
MSNLCIFPPSIGFRFLFIRPVKEFNEEVSEIILDINNMSLDNLYEFEEYKKYNSDISLILQPNIIQDSEIFEEILNFEEPENPELIEEMLQNQSNEELRNSDIEELEIEINKFPNEVFTNLITLVTKHNLNNKAGNTIIKFFNKHSNVSVSLLSKNIVIGQRYMD